MNSLSNIPFSISSSKGYSTKNNDSELLNMFVHIEEAGSKSNHILMNTEGAKLLATVSYEIYGTYEYDGVVYIATEKLLYEFNVSTKTFKSIGAVSFDSKVTFADNGIDIVIVGGGNGYAYTPSSGFLRNMDIHQGWYPAGTVCYMDGYFIFNRIGTGQFFISRLYSTSIDPIDWSTAEAAPDNTVAVVVSNRQLWLFGEKTIEIWYDSGNPDFPFTRINGSVTDVGTANYKSISSLKENIYFVGNDFKVYMTLGYRPNRISTPAIEKRLSMCDPELLYGFSFINNGHSFYVIHIDNIYTYVYDKDTGQWHMRMSCDKRKWFIDGTIKINNSSELFGNSGSNFYSLSIEHYTEDGKPIRREAISLPINKGVNRFILAEMQLDMETGFQAEGKVLLQLSDDGGVTWSNNHLASTGAVGDVKHRVRWLRLGQHRDCIVKIVITDPIPIRILGLYARYGQ